MKFKSHKIRKIDKSICNCEQKIAYNYLVTYYDSMNKNKFLDFTQNSLAREKNNSMKKYDIDLIYHYILQSYDRYIANKYHILASYEEIGSVIYSDYFKG